MTGCNSTPWKSRTIVALVTVTPVSDRREYGALPIRRGVSGVHAKLTETAAARLLAVSHGDAGRWRRGRRRSPSGATSGESTPPRTCSSPRLRCAPVVDAVRNRLGRLGNLDQHRRRRALRLPFPRFLPTSWSEILARNAFALMCSSALRWVARSLLALDSRCPVDAIRPGRTHSPPLLVSAAASFARSCLSRRGGARHATSGRFAGRLNRCRLPRRPSGSSPGPDPWLT